MRLGGAIQPQTAPQTPQIQHAQADQGAGQQIEGAGPLGRGVGAAEPPCQRGPRGRQDRPGGGLCAQQHRRSGGRQGHTAAAQLAGHGLGADRGAHDHGHRVPGGGAVNVLAAQHPGDMGGLLRGRGGHEHAHALSALADLSALSALAAPRLLGAGGVQGLAQERAAVRGGAGHRDPPGLVAPDGVQSG